ncbi:Thioredoxin-related [hydrothermal vent metagenome]|uniref:Thioredoxin-related n=1 Tax=hydrothermal vent metagenome TaxID=652676 RepID=A0A1W1BSQ7_9ZZZZ
MKNWSIKKIIKEIVTTLLMVFVISMVLNYIRKPDSANNQLSDLNVSLISGQQVSLMGKDKPIVIHFWATWCPTCKLEAPNLETIKDKAHLISVAVNSGSDSELRAFMKERGYSYNVVNDNEGKLSDKFGVEVFPTTFIYDAKGTLEFLEVGYSSAFGLKARLALVR